MAATSGSFVESKVVPVKAPGFWNKLVLWDAKKGLLPPTILPVQWRTAATSVVTCIIQQRTGAPGIICVCGGKGVGKNVYTRLLVNTMLFSLGEPAVIGGDCVQTEFGSPGLVSLTVLKKPLLAPGALHIHRSALETTIAPLKSCFVGSSPKVLLSIFSVSTSLLFPSPYCTLSVSSIQLC